jgi:hypothetical protein
VQKTSSVTHAFIRKRDTIMKIRTLHVLTMFALLALSAVADDARVNTYKNQLGNVRRPELAQETARLVSQKQADAADAVTAAIALNSSAAPMIVGSVAKASPASAATAAAAALRAQPKSVGVITKAAVSAAPSEVSAIVTELCKVQPAAFYRIALAAAEAAPKSSDAIVPAITAALPALKPLVERAQSDFQKSGQTASLALLLKHTENLVLAVSRDQRVTADALLVGETDVTMTAKMASTTAGLPPPPVQGTPFVAGGGAPGEIPGSSTTEVSFTNRVYSAP